LSGTFHELARLRVLFAGKPTLEELKNARALLPLSPTPALQEFFRRHSTASEIDAGVMATRQARRIAEECEKVGLKVDLQNESYSSYLPVNRATQHACIIEDDALLQRVCKRMIEHGIPITVIAEG
jgi:hypothetical protein